VNVDSIYNAGLIKGYSTGVSSVNKDSIYNSGTLAGKRAMWDAIPSTTSFTPAAVLPPTVQPPAVQPPAATIVIPKPPRP
jgi:hypothetical protein